MIAAALKLTIMAAAVMATITGCNRQNTGVNYPKEVKYDIAKMPDTMVDAEGDSLRVLIDVEEILMDGGDIICVSNLDTFAFHRLDADKLTEKEKFGRRGDGPGEFLSPKMLKPLHGDPYLIDSWKYRMLSMDLNDTIPYGNRLFNQPKEVDFPLIGYYTLDHGFREFVLYDVKNDVTTDSIDFQTIDEELKDQSLFWDTNGKKIVATFLEYDMIIIFDVVDGHLSNPVICRGRFGKGENFLLSVACLDDKFAVLTCPGELDDSAVSKIVVFDYDGNLLTKLNPDILAGRMIYDKENSRFILSGFSTEALYKVAYK